jgi:hypothetical protein
MRNIGLIFEGVNSIYEIHTVLLSGSFLPGVFCGKTRNTYSKLVRLMFSHTAPGRGDIKPGERACMSLLPIFLRCQESH